MTGSESIPLQPETIKAILWDVDGTLFSSEEIIHQIYQDCFSAYQKQHGVPAKIPTLPEIVAQIGKPVKAIFEALAPDISDEQRHELGLEILDGLVQTLSNGGGHHYAGAPETQRALHSKGYAVYGVSNGRLPYIEAILKANGTFALFTAIPTIDNQTIHDKAGLVAHVLQTAGLRPEQCVLIGDRTSDRDAARDNQVPFIAARYGHGAAEEWVGAAEHIDAPDDLLKLL